MNLLARLVAWLWPEDRPAVTTGLAPVLSTEHWSTPRLRAISPDEIINRHLGRPRHDACCPLNHDGEDDAS